MEKLDFHYICTFLGNLTGIPVRLYRNGVLERYYAVVQLPKDPMELYREPIFAITAHVGYFITPQFHYYGVVNSGDKKIVIGPTRQIIHNPQELRALAFSMDIPRDRISEFMAGMQNIVRMPLDSVMQMLCVVNYVLNGEKLGLEDISIYDTEQQDLRRALAAQPRNRQADVEADGIRIQQEVHNSLDVEQALANIIRKGDTAALKGWTASAPAVRAGVMAADQLRQIKNTFIVAATLASRAAIQGGMDAEDALSLSDAFIQKCELLTDVQRITNLQYRMILEYTEQVENLRRSAHGSELAVQVVNYIHHHLSEPITAEAIARHLYLSRPYLSAKFKEETGVSLTDFILNEKTEEAKRLLCHSDQSFMKIGDYLGFSSQSHFTRVFKKYTGYAPKEYREKYRN